MPSLAIAGGPALVGPDLTLIDDATIVVDGDKITFAGPSSEVHLPNGMRVVEAAGGLILPGFIDAHVHIGFFRPEEVLAHGVTTVRDLAWPAAEIFELARRSLAAEFAGPLVLAAGPMLTVPGGYPTKAAWAPPGTGLEVRSVDDAIRIARSTIEQGACIIKIALNAEVGPVLDRDCVRAIADTAHDAGLRVTAHIYGLGELEKALDCGVDEMAHMLMSPERIPDEIIARAVAQGLVVVSTLGIHSGPARDVAVDNLARFVAAGGRVVYGTDLGNEGPRPGIDAGEINALIEAGMSPRAVIAAATIEAAAWLELADKGALAAGRDADVIVVDPQGLTDPRALVNVRKVLRMGQAVNSTRP